MSPQDDGRGNVNDNRKDADTAADNHNIDNDARAYGYADDNDAEDYEGPDDYFDDEDAVPYYIIRYAAPLFSVNIGSDDEGDNYARASEP